MEANISLVLKKGKPVEEYSSYRPISVLNLDTKLLARVLASRLENVLPASITNDQTGFIQGRFSFHKYKMITQYHSALLDVQPFLTLRKLLID